MTSVSSTGPITTDTSLPVRWTASTRPTARDDANMILPGCRSATCGALASSVHVVPSGLSEWIACAPCSMSTTLSWYVTASFFVGETP